MKLALVLAFSASAFAQPRFEKDVLPIFTANCFACHGGRSFVGLDLRSAVSALRGSDQGAVIAKGDSAKSLLYQKISSRTMPPPAFNLKLTDAQIATVKQWIDAGCPSDEAEANKQRWKEQSERYEKDALPILKAKCFGCHANDKPMAGLDLRTLESALRGSANGPVIQEGVADKSILIRMITNGSMPPKGAGAAISADELQALRRWIDTTRFPVREARVERTAFTKAEAPVYDEKARAWWAFQKPVKAAVPSVKNKSRVRTPLDAFVLGKLESKGLAMSPEASPISLMRRLYFDLTGLPPTPKEIDEFLSDTKPGAYERLVDRLLESPHYGERWGRFWLDAAGYTDAAGFDNDLPGVEMFDGIWRYRDYVVNAFNKDKPYDRFLREQLAGDEMFDWRKASKYAPEMREALVATGYLRSVYDRTDADIVNLIEERYDVLVNLMEKVSTGIIGVTVNCARCHSHKFDPIAQRDYYRLQSVFLSAYNPMKWKQPKDRWLPDVSQAEKEEIEKHNAEIARQVGELKKQVDKLRKPYEDKLFEAKLTTVPEAVRSETKAAVQTPADQRNEVQKFLAGKFEKQLRVSQEEADKAMKEDERAYVQKLNAQMKTFEGYKRNFEKMQALWDVGPPPVAHLLQRGSVESPGPVVTPGVPAVLAKFGGDLKRPDGVPSESSGMRLAFAQWLTSPDQPLTARVFVNRVWQHHFGRGIVETSDNFGKMGTPPTNQELLDWMAADFMENGWKLKRLQKMILLSSVYRQASRDREDARAVDPENKLLWRKDMMRLEAEAVRDGVLVASGQLDRKVGGAPVKLKVRPDGMQELWSDEKNPSAVRRRSLYIMSRRNYPHQLLQVFDFPTIQVNCVRRATSATPLQSLAMLNDEFLMEQARLMAARAVSLGDPVESAYLLALSRKPDSDEKKLAAEHLKKQEEVYRFGNEAPEAASRKALASLCQMLLASNEFLYVD